MIAVPVNQVKYIKVYTDLLSVIYTVGDKNSIEIQNLNIMQH